MARSERAVHEWLRVATEFALTPSSRGATKLGTMLAVPDYDDLA